MQVIAVTVVGLIVAAAFIRRYIKHLKDRDELHKVRRHNQLLQPKH